MDSGASPLAEYMICQGCGGHSVLTTISWEGCAANMLEIKIWLCPECDLQQNKPAKDWKKETEEGLF